MLQNITLRQRFLAIAVLTLLLFVSIAAMGIWVAVSLSGALQQSATQSSALRNHMLADTMHDALRGDVLAAILAGESRSADQIEVVKADLEEHAATFRDAVAANASLDLLPDVREALSNVDAPLAEYIASAEQIVARALYDPRGAVGLMPSFNEKFKHLEDTMESAADVIEGHAEEQAEESTAATGLAGTRPEKHRQTL